MMAKLRTLADVCLHSHLTSEENDDSREALIWEGNYWDEPVHDYGELCWNTVRIVVHKIGKLFSKYARKKDCLLLFLPPVIQLPLSVIAASHVGLKIAVLNPKTATSNEILQVLNDRKCSLVVTVDGFWMGDELNETKKFLDFVIGTHETSVRHVFLIRHTAPNPGVPPPENETPARRPCYRLEFPLAEGRDLEWSQEIKGFDEDDIDQINQDGMAGFVCVKSESGDLELYSEVEILKFLNETSADIKDIEGPISIISDPSTLFGFISMLAPWFLGKTLVQFEGELDYPDPSRLAHLVKKYEVEALIIDIATPLDEQYISFVKTPSLKKIIVSTSTDSTAVRKAFKNVKRLTVVDFS